MTCLEVRDRLPELAVGVLPDDLRVATERHLKWCAGCRKEAADLVQAATSLAYALPPVPVPEGMEERVVSLVRSQVPSRAPKKRVRTAAASTVAAMVAISALGWGSAMAGRAERFADRAARAERERLQALEQFQKALSAVPLVGLSPEVTFVSQLSPVAGQLGGGAVLQHVSPSHLDFVIVIVNGLRPAEGELPYRVTVSNAQGEALKAGRIDELDADGGGDVFHEFKNQDLRGFTTVQVRDADGRVVLYGVVDQSAPEA